MNNNFNILLNQAKKFPQNSGVYIFKDIDNNIIYIGKAKNLKSRIKSYFLKNSDLKSIKLTQCAYNLEYIITKSELQAMLLEAELIKANQPKFNILLKDGQPFLYILFTNQIKITRNKKEQGTYFGPFLDKTETRKVYDFLVRTFKLKICNKKIDNGCLDYHLGICSGSCRKDFDKEKYLKRLNLAKESLEKGHKKFLIFLDKEIKRNSDLLNYEKAKELLEYKKAFNTIFNTLNEDYSYKKIAKSLTHKDIWILDNILQKLFVFTEINSVIKNKKVFDLIFNNNILEYITSYYANFNANNNILVNFNIKNNDKKLLESFIQKYQNKNSKINIIEPKTGHLFNLIKLAQIHARELTKNQKSLSDSLKSLLKLDNAPETIDCFDISHKQGNFMVGSCIRFKNGTPDPTNFRHFKIKTLTEQDDYAALQEIVARRYKDLTQLPDLVLIDGGKGQLSSINKILPNAQVISLAKREETVFSKNLPNGKKLNNKIYAHQVLIALRDYAHHFAISYHRKISSLK